ncbi:MAG TPA: tyrosine--tRNA ligase [Methylomirabilota bacterium]|jgi:tyrosyl-tRNA synthetase|nr:tyrosine--tRNA ligase [Methylomirabilota bacterium]
MAPPLPFRPAAEQFELIQRGTAAIVTEDELRAKLERSVRTRTPLVVKVGFDPTAPDLHLGHTVVIQKMRQLQELGHTIYFVIGDFTGMIGDPTGLSETRKPLTREQIQANAQTYQAQVFKILDPEQTRVAFNSEWLAPLRAADVIRMTAQVTVARLLSREDFAQRYESERPIHLHEFLYPLFQAQDSVALRADIEMGGTDQTFNLLVGRDLQRAVGQEAQIAITTPILVGTDGVQKMSKSLGNYVGITEPPDQMFGKLMSISDEVMLAFYPLVTPLGPAELDAIAAGVRGGTLHPMEAKKRLARTVVAQFHGEAAAGAAEEAFARQFQARETPADIPRVRYPQPAEGTIRADHLVAASGIAGSLSEARRLIQQGGVRIDQARIEDPYRALTVVPGQTILVQRGRREFRIVEVVPPAGPGTSSVAKSP